MDPQRTIALGLFDNLTNTVTGGLIPDIKVAMLACGGLLLIIFAFDIVVRIITGTAPSTRVSDWWEKTGDDQEYNAYKKKRHKKELMAARYESDKKYIGPQPKGKGFYQ